MLFIAAANDKKNDAQHDDGLKAEEEEIAGLTIQEAVFAARLLSHDGTKGANDVLCGKSCQAAQLLIWIKRGRRWISVKSTALTNEVKLVLTQPSEPTQRGEPNTARDDPPTLKPTRDGWAFFFVLGTATLILAVFFVHWRPAGENVQCRGSPFSRPADIGRTTT